MEIVLLFMSQTATAVVSSSELALMMCNPKTHHLTLVLYTSSTDLLQP